MQRKDNSIPRYFLIISIISQLLIGGVRFSDGNILRTISNGNDIYDPIFQNNPLTQYIWGSPLKIFFLKLISTNSFILLGLVFLIIGLLPLLGIFFNKKTRFYQLTSYLIIATPALKISLHNLGLGDGLISLLSIFLIINYGNIVFSFLSILLLGLWHPGQAPLIGVSAILSYFLKKDLFDYKSFKDFTRNKNLLTYLCSIFSGLFVSRIILIIYNNQLRFDYINRLEYLIRQAPDFLLRNVIYSPISLIIPAILIVLISFKIKKLNIFIKANIIVWIILCSTVSLLTTDVSRVVSLILTPLYLITLEHIGFPNSFPLFSSKISKKRLNIIIIIFFIVFLPNYGWEGVNISLWDNFFEDLCKYGYFCKSLILN